MARAPAPRPPYSCAYPGDEVPCWCVQPTAKFPYAMRQRTGLHARRTPIRAPAVPNASPLAGTLRAPMPTTGRVAHLLAGIRVTYEGYAPQGWAIRTTRSFGSPRKPRSRPKQCRCAAEDRDRTAPSSRTEALKHPHCSSPRHASRRRAIGCCAANAFCGEISAFRTPSLMGRSEAWRAFVTRCPSRPVRATRRESRQ